MPDNNDPTEANSFSTPATEMASESGKEGVSNSPWEIPNITPSQEMAQRYPLPEGMPPRGSLRKVKPTSPMIGKMLPPLSNVDLVERVGRKVGRPPSLDPDDNNTLKRIALCGHYGCTHEETAAFLLVSDKTLRNFFNKYPEIRELWDQSKEGGRFALRRIQFAHAEKNFAMAIFLGKNMLGQSDMIQQTNVNLPTPNFDTSKYSPEERQELMKLLSKQFDPAQQGDPTEVIDVEPNPPALTGGTSEDSEPA